MSPQTCERKPLSFFIILHILSLLANKDELGDVDSYVGPHRDPYVQWIQDVSEPHWTVGWGGLGFVAGLPCDINAPIRVFIVFFLFTKMPHLTTFLHTSDFCFFCPDKFLGIMGSSANNLIIC